MRVKNYFLAQTVANIKKNYSLIMMISLIVSVNAGILFFLHTYEESLEKEAITSINDFNVVFKDNIDIYSDFNPLNLVQDLRDLNFDIEEFSIYNSYNFSNLYLYRNSSQFNQNLGKIEEKYFCSPFQIEFYTQDYYGSPRFSEFITIVEGEFPQNSNEIMINYDVAKILNLHLNQQINLSLLGGEDCIVQEYNHYTLGQQLKFFNINNIIISGFYQIIKPVFRSITGTFAKPLNSTEILQDQLNLDSIIMMAMPIFGFHDFYHIENNPLIRNFCENMYSTYRFSRLNLLGTYQGTLLNIFRKSIDMLDLNTYIYEIQDHYHKILLNVQSSIFVENLLGDQLNELQQTMMQFHLRILGINLPLFLFLLFMVVIGTRFKLYNHQEELLLLRTVGTPQYFIIIQLVIEGIVSGILSGIIGFGIGIGIFHILNNSLYSTLLNSANPLEIKLNLNLFLIVNTISIIMTVLINLIIAFNLKGIKSAEILTNLTQREQELDYDEKNLHLFKNLGEKNSKKKKESGFLTFYSKYIRKQENITRITTIQDDKSTQYNIRYSSKISNFSPWLISGSFVPFLVILMVILNEHIIVGNSFSSYVTFLISNSFFLLILFVISPILLSLGIIRYIVVEKKGVFAYIINSIGKIFVHERSFLCTLNILRRKGYLLILLVVCLFNSIICYVHIGINSAYIYENINENVAIGADFQAHFKEMRYEDNKLRFSGGITSTALLLNMEENMCQYEENNKSLSINNVVSIQQEYLATLVGDAYFLNLSQYVNIIQEGDKFLPTNDLISSIQELIVYNSDPQNEIKSVIINSDFAKSYLVDENDIFSFFHQYYNSSSGDLESKYLSLKVFKIINVLPGLYGVHPLSYQNIDAGIVIDLNTLNMSLNLLHGFRIDQLIQISKDSTYSVDDYLYFINSAVKPFKHYLSIDAYNFEWKQTLNSRYLLVNGYFNILNLEFYLLSVFIGFYTIFVLIKTYQRDKNLIGNILARGLGKKSISQLFLLEILIIFFIAVLVGLFSGMIFIFPSLQLIKSSIFLYPNSWNLPIIGKWIPLIIQTSLIPLISGIGFGIYLIFHKNENITGFFQKKI